MIAERVFRALLILLPRWFRERHGEAMAVLFRRQLDEARARRGMVGAVGVTAGAIGDLIRRGWIQRRRDHAGSGGARRHAQGEGMGRMESFIQSVGQSLRSLVRAPAFTLSTLATLALGIGGATAIFTVVDGVMLRPLPFPDPGRVTHLAWARGGTLAQAMPYYKVDYWREQSRVFEGVTTSTVISGSLGVDPDEAVPVRVLGVDHDFFRVSGFQASLGRTLTEDDQTPGAQPVALLTHRLWTERFGADPDVRGRTIHLNGDPHTVVGVLGPDFTWPYTLGTLDAVVPLALEPDPVNETENFQVVARLGDGVDSDQVSADLDRVWARFQRAHPDIVNENDEGMRMASFTTLHVGDRAGMLWVLIGAIGMLLLIVCANVASLFMARTADRRREMAVRSALGASRATIVGQLLTESALLAILGGGLGVLLASFGVDLLLPLSPDPLPRGDTLSVDGRVLGFAAGVSLLTALLFGLPAALPAGRNGARATMGTRGGTATTRGRQLMIGMEAALSMVLLMGAGLLVATLFQLSRSDPGYDAHDVVAMSFPGIMDQVASLDDLQSLESRTRIAVAGLPGVEAAAWTSSIPLERGLNLPVGPDDRPDDVIGGTEWRSITPGYVQTMDLELTAGREFLDSDDAGGERVALVNENFAAAFFADGAIGEHIAIGRYRGRFISPAFEAPAARIVGVVADQRDISLRSEARPTVYVPRAQMTPALAGPGRLVIEGPRTLAAIRTMEEALGRAVPELPTAEVEPLSRVVDDSLAAERFHALLLGSFALLALLLTSMGIVGVVSYEVRRRRREIGIRIALGEGAGHLVRSMIGRGMLPILVGLAAGALASLFLAHTMESLLWGIAPTDTRTLVIVATLLAGVSLTASWLPARGAARADPVEALRAD